MFKSRVENLETARLFLRCIEKRDVQDLYDNVLCDNRVAEFLMWKAVSNLEEARKCVKRWIRRNKKKDIFNRWVIVEKESTKVIGYIGAFCYNKISKSISVGYTLGYNYWGKGYATEVLNELITYLFNKAPISINKIEGQCAVDNIASAKVMEKCGMRKEGIIMQALKTNCGLKMRSNILFCQTPIKLSILIECLKGVGYGKRI